MGHGKLRKFAENETFRCLLQPDASSVLVGGSRELLLRDHPIKGQWRSMFAADQPIVLELGCGKGDYTIALALRHPEMNFIGVDIKGARLWTGAKYATEHGLPNVAFLRTRVEFLPAFFAPGEVSQIWLTFSDPQLSGSGNSRLSAPVFLERYRKFLVPGGVVHLKTDSRFLHEYTMSVIRANGLEILASGTDIYNVPVISSGSEVEKSLDLSAVTEVQTFYERMFLDMGLPITYVAFRIDHIGPYVQPTDFDAAYWRELEGPRRSFGHQPAPKC
ncbi:MAG: tRNA (guanosine(46)-N7)-methyltransferase TrmB [Bacteroidales bacterium]|nr:tRNA (guanosine(46)-N7)-methyltransferase TrmB [Bacteroidales bacterium]